MTIRRGQPWGEPYSGTIELPCVDSDSALAQVLAANIRHTTPVALSGGAIWEMLGRPKREGTARFATPLDLGVLTATVEGTQKSWYFVNELVFRNRFWRNGVAFMNGKMLGQLSLGHMAHPNDGLLDRVSWQLRRSELVQVRRRAILGSFAPHPRISQDRRRSFQLASAPADALVVSADGKVIMNSAEASRLTEIKVEVIPDAGIVVA